MVRWALWAVVTLRRPLDITAESWDRCSARGRDRWGERAKDVGMVDRLAIINVPTKTRARVDRGTLNVSSDVIERIQDRSARVAPRGPPDGSPKSRRHLNPRSLFRRPQP